MKVWNDINPPSQERLYDADGKLVRAIEENKVEALAKYKLGKVELLHVKTRDGFPMEAMMIKPPEFDPTKKYPVLEFTYSGPHAPQVKNAWGGSAYLWHQLMAEKGYIIWICDNRTASGKDRKSTRLNSSHSQISYAVFCLKKKKSSVHRIILRNGPR